MTINNSNITYHEKIKKNKYLTGDINVIIRFYALKHFLSVIILIQLTPTLYCRGKTILFLFQFMQKNVEILS